MLSSNIVREAKAIQLAFRRNYGVSAVLYQKASDPIQQLFVDKIREYAQKKKTAGGKLVDSNPSIEKQLQQELEKVARQYGGGPGVDMTKFPSFKFEDPKVDPQV
ncbi:ATP synthase-coupling factor 6, mitochondrial [Armadillidium nasatum]|uniref:ATP synthase-coupling factor 6, mitochondrial n=1 Tax=Armadillidium nasatum TaxID=96803 RepID=A0A5N5TB21_9CRUS|nr:ATP synthase-coupling factor 6, mitochondrial [Armadillidium nasatum]